MDPVKKPLGLEGEETTWPKHWLIVVWGALAWAFVAAGAFLRRAWASLRNR
jgi:hypothetical protein